MKIAFAGLRHAHIFQLAALAVKCGNPLIFSLIKITASGVNRISSHNRVCHNKVGVLPGNAPLQLR